MLEHNADKAIFTLVIHPFRAAGAKGKYSLTFTFEKPVAPGDIMATLAIMYPMVFRDMQIYTALTGRADICFGPFGHLNQAVGEKVLVQNPDTGELMLGWDEFLLGLITASSQDMAVNSFMRATGVEEINMHRISHVVDSDHPGFPYLDPNTYVFSCQGITEWDGPTAIPGQDHVDMDVEAMMAQARAERPQHLRELLPLVHRLIHSAQQIQARDQAAQHLANQIAEAVNPVNADPACTARLHALIERARQAYLDASVDCTRAGSPDAEPEEQRHARN